jgi:hypothetical protein
MDLSQTESIPMDEAREAVSLDEGEWEQLQEK